MSHPNKEPDINQRHTVNHLSDIVKWFKLTFSFEMKAWKAQLQGPAEWLPGPELEALVCRVRRQNVLRSSHP